MAIDGTAFRCYSPSPDCLQVTSAGYTAGDVVKVENTIGIIVETKATGEDAELCYRAAKIELPKSTDSTEGVFAAGDAVYYDAGDGNFNNASGGNTKVGIALEAAAASATYVLVDFDGSKNG